VLSVIADFLKAYPEVDVRLKQTDRPVGLHEEQVDAAVRIGHLPDSSLRARRLGNVRRVLCASPAYLAAKGRPERPEDVAEHACISFESVMPVDRWSFGDEGDRHHIGVRSRMMVNTAEAAVDAAVAGLGITRVLSYQVAEAVAANQLELLLAPHEPAPWPVSILYRDGLAPQKLRAFIDFAAPRLESILREVERRLA